MNARRLRVSYRALALLVLPPMLAVAVRAAEPFLVADIDATGTGSFPHDFVELDGRVYFIADDTVHGRELWVSDGTAAGTRRITDLDPGEGDSLASGLVAFDGRLFFPATPGDQGAELFASDGSGAGTAPLGTVEQTGIGVRELTVAAGRLYYVAFGGTTELLYASDGTAGGTAPLALFRPRQLTPTDAVAPGSGPVLFFSAEGEVAGRSLWVTDGTPSGTVARAEVIDPAELAALPGGRVVAAVETRPNVETWELWVSDGSEGGTQVLLEITSSGGPFIDLLTVAGGRLFFTVSDGYGGFDLWLTDGTTAGTVMITPLLTEEPSEVPRLESFAPLDDRLLFQGFEPATGHELWITDGTAAGTEIFDDIVPGPESSDPRGLVSVPNQVFFTASTPEHGRELWATGIPFDEEVFATVRVTDANPGPGDSSPGALRFLGGRLWLSLSDGTTGPEPWVSDGSPGGTRRVAVLNSLSTASSSPTPSGTLGSVLFFSFRGNERDDADTDLWRSDGSPSGTFPLSGAAGPARLSYRFEETLAEGDFLYFSGSAGEGSGTSHELWRSDGETAEPVTALDSGERLGDLASLGDGVLFVAPAGGELGLYRFAGGSTTRLAGFGPALLPFTGSARLLAGRALAYVLVPGPHGSDPALWVTDGTAAGTAMVTTLETGATLDRGQVLADRLFFASPTPGSGNELWTSDGTAAGTRLAADLLPGELPGNPHDFAELDGWLYFVANAGDSFEESAHLWRIDATGTVVERVHRQCVDFGSLRSASGSLFFVPCTRRDTLWSVEGEPPVARQVAELDPPFPVGFALLRTQPLLTAGGLLYFLLEDAEAPGSLSGIWVSDGTDEGTRLFTAESGSLARPGWVQPAGGLVFFDSDDGIHGRELWAAPLECFSTGRTLCLGDDRFQARARWRDFAGKAGGAPTVPVSNESGGFWFFDEQNPELFLKTLDGRAINGRFWVFFGSLSNVPFDVEVVDTATGAERLYRNPSGRFASFGDTDAFDGESSGSTVVVPPSAPPPEVSTGAGAPAPCVAGPETECQLGRFRVEVEWQDFAGGRGAGRVRGLSGDLEGFWFFDPDNVELVVKVLDGRPINGHYWVFFGSLTDVAFELTVTDSASGARRIYRNPAANFASFGDSEAFAP